MVVLLLTLLSIYNAAALSAPPCAVRPNPRLSIAPLRAAVITVTIEPGGSWRTADLVLVDAGGPVRSSRLFEGDGAGKYPRTTLVEWRNLTLAAGEYEVVLLVAGDAGGCRAVGQLSVKGEEP